MRKNWNFNWGGLEAFFDEDKKESPSEILCYDTIGKDPWTGEGLTAKDFLTALNSLPTDRDLTIKINSRGGDVREGTTMNNDLKLWKARNGRKLYTDIMGIAASTGSWFSATVSDEVRAFKNAQVFIHDAITFGMGNAQDFREAADNLDKTSDQIAQMYADKTGKGKRTIRDLMRKSTLLTGEEAKDLGLVDKILDNEPGKKVRNFTSQELVVMQNTISQMYNLDAERGRATNKNQKAEEIMKKKLIELLNKSGMTEWDGKAINEEMSDEDLYAALAKATEKKLEQENKLKEKSNKAKAKSKLADDPEDEDEDDDDGNGRTINELRQELKAEIAEFKQFANVHREAQVDNRIQQLLNDDVITEKEKPKIRARALKDPTYLDEIALREPNRPGTGPLRPAIELVGNSFNDVQRFLLANGPGFMKNFIGSRAADNGDILGPKVMEDIRNHAMVVANTIKTHRKMLVESYNAGTNTIDAGLQRQIILQEMLEEFAVILLPLQNFSTVFSNVPLEGTDEVDVPFYPLATDAGNSWSAATGYAAASFGDTATNTRPVVIGGSGLNSGSSAAANTAKDRKWIGASFSSYEVARQPYLNIQKLMIQKANRLAVLIFQDIVSRCITAANFAASVKAVAAVQFSADDVADLWEVATGRMWPAAGRSLILTHQYRTPLLKDPTYKQYLSYGATDPNRKAVIKEAYGFEDLPIVPNLNTYSPAGENLVGWINWMYALLVATAPIMPTPEVRALMTRYDLVVHPSIGLALEYRRFGDTTLDVTKETVECSYGANKGVASALARITSS
jgi:ATP-dependent protease ClpP protease subunit/ribosome-associated translation inhibitor RaiA